MFGQWLGQWPGQWYGGESTGEPGITGEIVTTLQGALALFAGEVTGAEPEPPPAGIAGGPGRGAYARSEIPDTLPLRGGSILSDADLQAGPDLRPDRIDRSGNLVLATAPGQRSDSIDRATVQAARATRPADGITDDDELMLVTALLAVMDDD